jgi:hypothetical protein
MKFFLKKISIFLLSSPHVSRWRWFVLVLLVVYIARVLAHNAGDFAVYYGAAKALRSGSDIYCNAFPVGNGEWCEYSYSPFFAFILIPLSYLPLWLADFIWLVLNLAALFRIYAILIAWLRVKLVLSETNYRWWVFLVTIFTVRFLLYNLDMSQITIILMWAMLDSIQITMVEKRRYWGGVLLALVITIKLMPVVILPYFLYRRAWRATLATCVSIAFFMLLPIFAYGFSDYWQVLETWFGVLNPTTAEFTVHQNFISEGLHSLSALVPALLTDEVTRYGIHRNIADLPFEKMRQILWAVQLFFVVLTVFFLRTLPFQPAKSGMHRTYETGYLLMVVPLIFPHQQKYAFFMILPAVAYIIFRLFLMEKGLQKSILIGIMVVVWLLTTASTDGIIGLKWYKMAQYFKAITWGTILLILPLAWLHPLSTRRFNFQDQPKLNTSNAVD